MGSEQAAVGVGFIRFGVPDLQKLEDFLISFGLAVGARCDGRVYFRGADDAPYLYVASQGAPAFQGLSFDLGSVAAVEAFAARWGGQIEDLDGPGRGRRVVVVDPDGFRVEAMAFVDRSQAVDLRASLLANTADAKPRLGAERRFSLRRAQVCRLGHVVLRVTDLRTSEAWYKARFGLLTSDEIDDGEGAFAMFLRLDRGAVHTDHHTLFLIQAETAGFHHAAFEVRDLDDLMVGHDHLREAGYRHHRGVGRHMLGGQVFDYWCDPWGHVLEHWTDGDLFDAAWGPRISTRADLMADMWRSPPEA